MSNLQEAAYPASFDYTAGSPHLKHAKLRSRVEESLTHEVVRLAEAGTRPRALEIGAGHGSFTKVLRQAGAEVVVTEMSGPAADNLKAAFADDADVDVVHDPRGTYPNTTLDGFDLVVAISVLHHIPDYASAVDGYCRVTKPGGSFISWQDPLWYARVPRHTRFVTRAAYISWRLGQGHFARGARTLSRRLRGIYDDSDVSDMSEYHVVRRGVDERGLLAVLQRHFEVVQLNAYWSTQSAVGQSVGEWLRLEDTFSIIARNRRQADPMSSARHALAT